ncbi:MAG: ChrR family anti-sigma-E factor [Agarilytica sp.]
MTNFHPSEDLLVEFSSGNLDWAVSITVSAHLHLCPACKQKITQLNTLGSAMLTRAEPIEVKESSFDHLMARIKNTETDQKNPGVSAQEVQPGCDRTKHLPSVVQKLIPKEKPLKWSFISPSLKAAQLETGQNKYEVSFHKIKRGGKVAEHDHKGLEVTLILEGSFSDAEGNYVVGDFLVKKPGEVHRPIAAQDQDCLCLSVVEAPVKVTGLMGKLINPFLSINPR